ncbi:MAG: OmpA family protein [Hyphomicrobiaceae bacterium]|nr:OmpA family protein [Hyphomicrobiaceae bacterium]
MNALSKTKNTGQPSGLPRIVLFAAGTLMIASSPALAQDWTQRSNQYIQQNNDGYNANRNWQRPPAYNPARAQGKRNAKRINKIINGLTPADGSHRHSKRYRRKIRKVVTWRKGYGNAGRPIIVNYNHSVDLSVFFKFNSAHILPQARPVLDDLGYALNAPKLRFARYLIAGHTDSRGARGYNQWLSEERAKAVANYLIYNFNIAPHRLLPVGFGEEVPANSRRPKSGVNRRVEVSLIENNTAYAPEQTIRIRKYNFTPKR